MQGKKKKKNPNILVQWIFDKHFITEININNISRTNWDFYQIHSLKLHQLFKYMHKGFHHLNAVNCSYNNKKKLLALKDTCIKDMFSKHIINYMDNLAGTQYYYVTQPWRIFLTGGNEGLLLQPYSKSRII